jgi:hypothetical protein
VGEKKEAVGLASFFTLPDRSFLWEYNCIGWSFTFLPPCLSLTLPGEL